MSSTLTPGALAFRRDLTPSWLSTALLLAGERHEFGTGSRVLYLTDIGSPLTDGPGAATTAAVVAACQPNFTVNMWTPEVSATAAGRTLQTGAGLNNLLVHELASPPTSADSGPADLVVIDGLLDSLDDARRSELLASVGSLLRPGGVVCASYRTTVGWSEVTPVVRLLRHLVARESRPAPQVIADAKHLLTELRTGDAGYLTQRPIVTAWLDELLASPPEQIVADYIARDLRPLSFAQVAAAFASIDCEFMGSAQLADSLGLERPARTLNLIDSAGSPELREHLDDLAVRRTRRTDVFRRGSLPLTRREQTNLLARKQIIGLPGAIETPALAALKVPARRRRSILAKLAGGPVPVADLEPDSGLRAPLVRALLCDGSAHSVTERHDSETEQESTMAARRVNRLIGAAPVPIAKRVIVVPLIGSAIAATPKQSASDLERLGVSRR